MGDLNLLLSKFQTMIGDASANYDRPENIVISFGGCDNFGQNTVFIDARIFNISGDDIRMTSKSMRTMGILGRILPSRNVIYQSQVVKPYIIVDMSNTESLESCPNMTRRIVVDSPSSVDVSYGGNTYEARDFYMMFLDKRNRVIRMMFDGIEHYILPGTIMGFKKPGGDISVVINEKGEIVDTNGTIAEYVPYVSEWGKLNKIAYKMPAFLSVTSANRLERFDRSITTYQVYNADTLIFSYPGDIKSEVFLFPGQKVRVTSNKTNVGINTVNFIDGTISTASGIAFRKAITPGAGKYVCRKIKNVVTGRVDTRQSTTTITKLVKM